MESNFFSHISSDYQLDPKDDRYTGFLNTNPSDFGEWTQTAIRIAKHPKKYKMAMQKHGLEFQQPTSLKEMVFYRIPPERMELIRQKRELVKLIREELSPGTDKGSTQAIVDTNDFWKLAEAILKLYTPVQK